MKNQPKVVDVDEFISMSWKQRDKALLNKRNRKTFMNDVYHKLKNATVDEIPDDKIEDMANWLGHFKRQYGAYLAII